MLIFYIDRFIIIFSQYHLESLVLAIKMELINMEIIFLKEKEIMYTENNEFSFLNSFTMKMIIIIGVLHMILGLILKGFIGIYFGDYVDFVINFVP